MLSNMIPEDLIKARKSVFASLESQESGMSKGISVNKADATSNDQRIVENKDRFEIILPKAEELD